jgi:hypothetical protein
MNFQGFRIGKKQREVVIEALTAVFAGKPGKWHVQFIGSGEEIEMRISGPGVETSEYVGAELDRQTVMDAAARVLAI